VISRLTFCAATLASTVRSICLRVA